MVWSACDNDLYECCVHDVDKAERGVRDEVAVLAQVDHRPNPDASGPKTVQRLELQRNDTPLLNSPVVKDLGDANMASPKNLADFVAWGMKNYPAENYWLVISDHGDAWRGACRDDGHADWMSLPQIQQGLQEAREVSGQKLNLVSFDCCHMASSEVVHQLRKEADYLVGSQEVMGYLGLPYQQILPQIGSKSPREVAQMLVEESRANPEDIPTFSAVDLSRVEPYSQALRELGQAVMESPLSGPRLKQVVDSAQCFDSGYYRDVVDLARKLAQASPDLQASAELVEARSRQLMVAEQHAPSHPGAHGLQIEVQPDSEETRQARYAQSQRGQSDSPDAPGEWRTERGSYAETAFARDTGWDRVIERINQP